MTFIASHTESFRSLYVLETYKRSEIQMATLPYLFYLIPGTVKERKGLTHMYF